MMLHHEYCPHCAVKNAYYQPDLKINKQIEEDVSKILRKFEKNLKMKNEANKTTEGESLKSVRGNTQNSEFMKELKAKQIELES